MNAISKDLTSTPGGSQQADAGGRMPAYTHTSISSPLYRAARLGSKAEYLESNDVTALEVISKDFNVVSRVDSREAVVAEATKALAAAQNKGEALTNWVEDMLALSSWDSNIPLVE